MVLLAGAQSGTVRQPRCACLWQCDTPSLAAALQHAAKLLPLLHSPQQVYALACTGSRRSPAAMKELAHHQVVVNKWNGRCLNCVHFSSLFACTTLREAQLQCDAPEVRACFTSTLGGLPTAFFNALVCSWLDCSALGRKCSVQGWPHAISSRTGPAPRRAGAHATSAHSQARERGGLLKQAGPGAAHL